MEKYSNNNQSQSNFKKNENTQENITEKKKIEDIAKNILQKYLPAFKELAK